MVLSVLKQYLCAIMHFLHVNRIYEFPDDIGPSCVVNGGTEKENEKERRENRKMKERVPFAVVGSNTLIPDPDGGERKIRGRKYPWGTVNVSYSKITQMGHFEAAPPIFWPIILATVTSPK